jgi:hypothetical protein
MWVVEMLSAERRGRIESNVSYDVCRVSLFNRKVVTCLLTSKTLRYRLSARACRIFTRLLGFPFASPVPQELC